MGIHKFNYNFDKYVQFKTSYVPYDYSIHMPNRPTLALCDIRVFEKHKNCPFYRFPIDFLKRQYHHQLSNTPGNLLNTKSHFPPEMEIRGFERIATIWG